MPELPDITIYREALERRILNQRLSKVRVRGPSLLRSVDPPLESIEGRIVSDVSRLGKRLILEFDGGVHLAIHLMIAGRFRWQDAADPAPKSSAIEQARMEFTSGTLILTEAGTHKRAAIHLFDSPALLRSLHRGGIDVLTCSLAEFERSLQIENHTLKRALTDPRLFDGIGNAYSDEILHAARLSPVLLTRRLTPEQQATLHQAARRTLQEWTERLRRDFGMDRGRGRFPGRGEITAFRPDFAVHGRFGKPCPVCGSPVQRIVHAENETNYCARCQNSGKVLADRSLSRLLKEHWPRDIDDIESAAPPHAREQ